MSQRQDRAADGGPATATPTGDALLESMLTDSLARAKATFSDESVADWSNEVAAAVRSHSSGALHCIKGLWQQGALAGELLASALEEISRARDASSKTIRRNMLMEALDDEDPMIRFVAAQGLASLADHAATARLRAALDREENPMVKSQLENAARAASGA